MKKTFDFGRLKISEKECVNDDGEIYLLLELDGPFEGFEEGSSGHVGVYFDQEIPKKTNKLIIDVSKCKYLCDVGYVIVKKLKREFTEDGGNLILVAPSPNLKDVLEISSFISCTDTVKEAEKLIKKKFL